MRRDAPPAPRIYADATPALLKAAAHRNFSAPFLSPIPGWHPSMGAYRVVGLL